jgi:hypothetical protein
MFSENKERVKIAGEVRERALSALQLDPHNDLAHHILGRWEYEMVRCKPFIQTLPRWLSFTTGVIRLDNRPSPYIKRNCAAFELIDSWSSWGAGNVKWHVESRVCASPEFLLFIETLQSWSSFNTGAVGLTVLHLS